VFPYCWNLQVVGGHEKSLNEKDTNLLARVVPSREVRDVSQHAYSICADLEYAGLSGSRGLQIYHSDQGHQFRSWRLWRISHSLICRPFLNT